MALKKQTTFKGLTAEYWVVTSLSWKKAQNKTEVVLALFKDKATRDLGLNNALPIRRTFNLDGEVVLADVYPLIKNTETFAFNTAPVKEFENAEDC